MLQTIVGAFYPDYALKAAKDLLLRKPSLTLLAISLTLFLCAEVLRRVAQRNALRSEPTSSLTHVAQQTYDL